MKDITKPISKKVKREVRQVLDLLSVNTRAEANLAPESSTAAAGKKFNFSPIPSNEDEKDRETSEDERPCPNPASVDIVKEETATNEKLGILGQHISCIHQTHNQLITKQDIVELKAYIANVENNILKEHQTTQNLLKRVLEEVKTASHSQKPTKRNLILPKTPFSTATDFMEFERKVQSSENKFEDLVSELGAQISSSSTKFLKISWKAIMADEAARHYCWKGTSSKYSVRALRVTAALKQAHKQKFNEASDAEFEATNIAYFQHANNRFLKKKAYEEAKSKIV